jgi:hypothetical protein
MASRVAADFELETLRRRSHTADKPGNRNALRDAIVNENGWT